MYSSELPINQQINELTVSKIRSPSFFEHAINQSFKCCTHISEVASDQIIYKWLVIMTAENEKNLNRIASIEVFRGATGLQI